jgi:hypothetical protein
MNITKADNRHLLADPLPGIVVCGAGDNMPVIEFTINCF